MKTCKRCGEEKEDSEFYNKDSSCKVCRCKVVTEHRQNNLERVQEYDRQRRAKANCTGEVWERFLERSRNYSKNNPEAKKATSQKYIEANPKKRDCHVQVGNAIKYGKLVPQPCEVCGNADVHGHHCDYNQPLDVLWLCAEHHAEWHKIHGEALNAS